MRWFLFTAMCFVLVGCTAPRHVAPTSTSTPTPNVHRLAAVPTAVQTMYVGPVPCVRCVTPRGPSATATARPTLDSDTQRLLADCSILKEILSNGEYSTETQRQAIKAKIASSCPNYGPPTPSQSCTVVALKAWWVDQSYTWVVVNGPAHMRTQEGLAPLTADDLTTVLIHDQYRCVAGVSGPGAYVLDMQQVVGMCMISGLLPAEWNPPDPWPIQIGEVRVCGEGN